MATCVIAAFTACSQPTAPTVKSVPEEMVDAAPPPPKPFVAHDLAIALVIDRSGSMTGPKLDAAKTAAKGVSDALFPKDVLDVIAFDSTPQRVVSMQPGDQPMANDAAIDGIAAGGGTDILPAMVDAFDDLSAASARRKHVVLVTDGQAPTAGLAEIVETAAAEGITLSTIALGFDADELTLRSMASTGGGRFYLVSSPYALSAVFTQELAIVRPGW
jgi:Mg-chelatase subunit ChlD